VAYATRIKIFDGRGLRGETCNIVFGSIWLRIPEPHEHPVAYWIEHLVHEISHLQLIALGIHDKLVLNSDVERFPAPIREDPRPMFGVLHATFVLARMVRIFRRLARVELHPTYGECLEKFSAQFDKGLSVVGSTQAKLTPAAYRIRDSLPVCALEG
jgi:HEXXH motif-containing protein